MTGAKLSEKAAATPAKINFASGCYPAKPRWPQSSQTLTDEIEMDGPAWPHSIARSGVKPDPRQTRPRPAGRGGLYARPFHPVSHLSYPLLGSASRDAILSRG